MSWLHPGILYGLILAAIPVVLHFLMRARPRHYDFPALRLLENIRKQNVQRMRLRHLGLLLLRIFVLILIVLAVARPTLPAANYGFTGAEWLRVLIVLAVCVVGYLIAQQFWIRRSTGSSQKQQRQSWLRTMTVTTVLSLLLWHVFWPYQQRVRGEIRDPGDLRQLNVPAAAVLLFDVSPSMGYQFENKNRLEEAFELARQQVQGLPGSSKVAMTDNAQAGPVSFLNDLQTATNRLQRTDSQQPREISQPLNDRVLAAISLQENDRQKVLNESGDESDRFLREIYIYTDGTRSAWSLEEAKRLRAEMERCPWLHCYVIDVGIEEATNFTLRQLTLSQDRTVQGGLVRVTADIDNQSRQPLDTVIELYLEDQSGQTIKRDQQAYQLEAEQSGQVTFSLPAERLGVLQGELRLASPDPLEIDNRLPFSIQVEQRPLILMVGENADEMFVWQQALAPDMLVERGGHAYDIEQISPQRVVSRLQPDDAAKKRPDVVYLLNVSRMSSAGWSALRSYVEAGGGLGMILGHTRVDVQNFRDYEQASWLPALPAVYSRADPAVTLEVNRSDHPVFEYLSQLDVLGMYSSAEVRRFWKTDLQPQAEVLARFRDEAQTPAVITGLYGRGRIVMLTTAVDLQGAATQQNWSELARLGWVYAAWADQLTRYLRSGETSSINRAVGQTMVLTLPETFSDQEVLLQLPGLRQGKIHLPYQTAYLRVTTGAAADAESSGGMNGNPETFRADQLGNYRVVLPQAATSSYGFSLHLPPQETNLARLSFAELDELFGPDRWQLSRSYAELERTVLLGRIGQEAYPLLVTLLIVFFVSEHLVANFFYGKAAS